MAKHGDENGFLDELIEMLVNKPFWTKESDIGEFMRDEEIPFNLKAFINTLDRITIPSEELPKGDFTEKLPRGMGKYTKEGDAVNRRTLGIGTDIVLSQILKQLQALPSETANSDLALFNDPDLKDLFEGQTPQAFANVDISSFFFNPLSNVAREDLRKGTNRSLIDLITGREI